MIKKCLFPAAGYGTRFLPATKAMPKEMLPVVNKPLIQYAVEEALEAGLSEIGIVTGRGKRSLEDHFDISYELEHQIRNTDKEKYLVGIRRLIDECTFAYTRQVEMKGLPGKEHAITSNEAFFLERLPRRVLVVGGGYIAVEFASIFNGLGAETILLYRRDLFLRGFDRSVREHLRDELGKKGLDLQFNSDIARIDKQADGSLAATLKDGRVLEADCVFYATGRRPMLDDLGLENTGVKLTDKGFIAVDEHYQTSEPSILALGDVIGRVQLTPVALAEGMAVARRLFKPEEYRPVDYKLIPTAVFSLPNIGTVGLTEEEALSAGHKVKIFESRFRPMKLTLTDDQEKTLMKLVVDAHDDRVLGCHMVGAEAGEILQGIAVAMKAGATKQAFDETIGIHPTAAEEFVTLRTPTR